MDSEWEGIAAKTLEELPQVISYVKNQFLGFAIPYVKEGKDHNYFTDFIVRCKGKEGTLKNLMVEISGFSKDKAEKNGLSKIVDSGSEFAKRQIRISRMAFY